MISTLKLIYATLVVVGTLVGIVLSGASLLQLFSKTDTLGPLLYAVTHIGDILNEILAEIREAKAVPLR